MHLNRTRFANDIVAEFGIPNKPNGEAIILLDGMPGIPSKAHMAKLLVKQGYWVFYPRYRGSWESEGDFLSVSPETDAIDVISQLPKGFKDSWGGEEYSVNPTKIHIICGSFGGPAGILASIDKRINKVVAVSPVVDWTEESEVEPLDFLGKFVKDGFGEGYRFKKEDWEKLKGGKFYNPVSRITEIDGSKLWIVHAEDDDVVMPNPVKDFAEKIGSKLTMKKKGGHLSTSSLFRSRLFMWKVKKFLNK